jgi:[histone H3]-trimethyl-L-lysine4 demethylase
VPELLNIPKGQWFCHKCLSQTGVDYGFDEGEEHSLSTFLARDLAFRRIWFESHLPPSRTQTSTEDYVVNKFGNVSVSETDVEEEFWRLIQSPHETVEVEYGADVHSTTHGRCVLVYGANEINGVQNLT